ncbi:MAG TPA: FtsX-like permease family protein [Bryobacteraceae bacterium]|jgi:putative ABC transport system permease protein
MLVFGAVLLVLLISCLNVANLWLARLSERRRELAVRAALGSGQSRIVRQVLAESLLLSLLGSALGILLAYAGLAWYRALNPIELTVGAVAAMNMPVLIFSLTLSIATTLIFGLLPALRASKVDVIEHLKSAGRGLIRGHHYLAESVIALEMAISFLLLIGATLLMTSAIRMGSENLGFHYDRIQSARIALPASRYSTDTQQILASDRLLEALERTPGVDVVTVASRLPPDAGGNEVLEVQGRTVDPAHEIHDVGADTVSPGYFHVLDIPIRQGRAFDTSDRNSSAPVTIINEALANEYFPHTDPLGRQIRIAGEKTPWLTVVGVAGNVKHTQLMNEMSWVETPILYRPIAQDPRLRFQLGVRASASIARKIEEQIAAIDPSIPLDDVEPLASRLATTLAYPRFRATVLSLFGLAALILSSVGLHGVLAQIVSRRIPEFGIRKALGAQTYSLLWLIARQGGLPIAAGLATGIVLTLVLSRILSNLLYGVQPADPVTLVFVSLILLAVASLAILSPAIHAARVDPMRALRDE